MSSQLCVNKNTVKRLGFPYVPVAQRLKHPIGVKEVVGSSPTWSTKTFSVVL